MSVPFELGLLLLVGLAGFGLGWLLRRRSGEPEVEPIELGGRTAIVSQPLDSAIPPEGPINQETVATLAAASQAIHEIHLLPTCPHCGNRMELRVFKEKKIWVCDDFPGCRGARMDD